MKKTLYIIFLILSVAMAGFTKPIITIINNIINLGELPQETKKSFIILIKNSGTTELQIKDIQTPCGCTKTFLSKEHIQPEETATVTIFFDTGKFSGKVQKYVEIVSNDMDIPYYKVYFQANVYQEFIAEPEACDFTHVVRRLGKTLNLSIRHKDGVEFDVQELVCNKEKFDVSWKGSRRENAFLLNVRLVIKPGTPAGRLEEEIRFFFAPDKLKQLTLPVSAVIMENDLFFDPGFVRFTTQIREVQIFLKNYSQAPFMLKEIKNRNPHFQVTSGKISDHEYKLDFHLADTKVNFFDTIVIVTDIPGENETVLRISY